MPDQIRDEAADVDTRIPATLEVTVRFDGAETTASGRTRDVSKTGASMVFSGAAWKDAPEDPKDQKADVTFSVGADTILVRGTCAWLERRGDDGALVGVEFGGADPAMVERLLKHAQTTYSRPIVVRTALIVVIVASLLAALLLLTREQAHQKNVAELDTQLQQQSEETRAAALELEQTMRALETVLDAEEGDRGEAEDAGDEDEAAESDETEAADDVAEESDSEAEVSDEADSEEEAPADEP